jgi:hypothetical protein
MIPHILRPGHTLAATIIYVLVIVAILVRVGEWIMKAIF